MMSNGLHNSRQPWAALLLGASLWGCSQEQPPSAASPRVASPSAASASPVIASTAATASVEANPLASNAPAPRNNPRPRLLIVPDELESNSNVRTETDSPSAADAADTFSSSPLVATATPQPMSEPIPLTPAETAFQTLLKPGVAIEDWETAHDLLVELGAEAAPALRQGLKSSNPMARECAATILAMNPAAAALTVDELKLGLNDRTGFVRANVATALLSVPGQDELAAPVLVELMRSSDVNLRRIAAVNLGNLATLPAPLVAEVTSALNDSDPEVVRPLVDLLGRSGTSARGALPRLQQIAFEPTDAELRSAAQQAVQLIESAN